MSKGYEDLSRRALIQLNKDFDLENDAELLQYLMENDDKYEGIRPIESLINRADQIKDSVSGSTSIIKKTINNEIDRLLNTLVDTLSTVVKNDK